MWLQNEGPKSRCYEVEIRARSLTIELDLDITLVHTWLEMKAVSQVLWFPEPHHAAWPSFM